MAPRKPKIESFDPKKRGIYNKDNLTYELYYPVDSLLCIPSQKYPDQFLEPDHVIIPKEILYNLPESLVRRDPYLRFLQLVISAKYLSADRYASTKDGLQSAKTSARLNQVKLAGLIGVEQKTVSKYLKTLLNANLLLRVDEPNLRKCSTGYAALGPMLNAHRNHFLPRYRSIDEVIEFLDSRYPLDRLSDSAAEPDNLVFWFRMLDRFDLSVGEIASIIFDYLEVVEDEEDILKRCEYLKDNPTPKEP